MYVGVGCLIAHTGGFRPGQYGWLYALYAFEYKWLLHGWKLRQRLRYRPRPPGACKRP